MTSVFPSHEHELGYRYPASQWKRPSAKPSELPSGRKNHEYGIKQLV